MEELKNVEELKKIVEDDSRAIQILDKAEMLNKKDYKYHISAIISTIVGFALIIAFFAVPQSEFLVNHFVICIVTPILGLAFIGLSVYFYFGSHKGLTFDEILFLNEILKERTISSVGRYPIIQKRRQMFYRRKWYFEVYRSSKKSNNDRM